MRMKCLLIMLFLVHASADSVLVSVQSQSQDEMDTLTAAVDAEVRDVHSGMRTTLGAIEATMSRVVDVDDPYFQAPVLSVPTWALLHDIAFDQDTSTWSFQYRSMRADPGTLNQFHRVLYMTKHGNMVQGDVGNKCLQDGVQLTGAGSCFEALMNDYTVPEALNEVDRDYLIYADTITSTQTTDSHSVSETITIQIPHTRVREGQDALAKLEEYSHPTLGPQRQWSFGIGVLFHGVGNNLIIFDSFHLIENSFEQVAISRSNSYSLARHVSFWTQQVQSDTSMRVAIIEYVISSGYTVQAVNSSLNGQAVTTDECTAMQTKLDSLSNKKCIYERTLCQPHVLVTTGSGTDGNTFIQYAIPLPDRASSPFQINSLLTLEEVATGREILSSLNFKTHNAPQDVCSNAATQTFDPTTHVSVNLYKGHGLVLQNLEDVYEVQNISDTAMGLPETLLTLVFSPKDSVADQYFADFPSENINLDELYISHALDSALLPDSLSNQITGSNEGRSTVTLDSTLLANCPIEDANLNYETAECVTTQDWGLTGKQLRPRSGGNEYFVRRVTGVADDVEWLRTNVFAQDSDAALAFFSNTEALVPSASRRARSQIYYIFPVYKWYDASPIGLKDTALVSFSWSVSKTSVQSRRLLSTASMTSVFNPPAVQKRRRSVRKVAEPVVKEEFMHAIQGVRRQGQKKKKSAL